MARRQKTAKRPKPKTVLWLPDLEQSQNAIVKFAGGNRDLLADITTKDLAQHSC